MMEWIRFFKSLFTKPRPITYYELNEHIARTMEAVEDDLEVKDTAEKLHRGT